MINGDLVAFLLSCSTDVVDVRCYNSMIVLSVKEKATAQIVVSNKCHGRASRSI